MKSEWRLIILLWAEIVHSLVTLNVTSVGNMWNSSSIAYNNNNQYVDLSCKMNYSMLDGPGKHLMGNVYLGETIARETFVTQFVMDIATVTNIHTDRIFVIEIAPGTVHYSWESTTIIILFRILDNTINTAFSNEANSIYTMHILTEQSQNASSVLYQMPVTKEIDIQYGIVAVSMDASLKLQDSITSIGGSSVRGNGTYLNQGSENWCNLGLIAGNVTVTTSQYCVWETWFKNDLMAALNISLNRIFVLSIKPAGLDSSLVMFRLLPPSNSSETSISNALSDLLSQVKNSSSPLYFGNVTFRIDSTWGVSDVGGVPRRLKPIRPGFKFNYATMYQQCRATQACPLAFEYYNSANHSSSSESQIFPGGEAFPASLYATFEDSRGGTFGWQYLWSMQKNGSVSGAHFSPFDYPTGGTSSVLVNKYKVANAGLVLDGQQRDRDLHTLQNEIDILTGELSLALDNGKDIALMEKGQRSKSDLYLNAEKWCFEWGQNATCYTPYRWYDDHNGSLASNLTSIASECSCSLLFNTSNLELTGVVNASAYLNITNGVEIAVWSFEQVRVGPEIRVEVVGQRPMALLSHSTMLINTTISIEPGTLGGMPGGGPIYRFTNASQSDNPVFYDLIDLVKSNSNSTYLPSNNVNGQGAQNLRYYIFTVNVSCNAIHEKQQVCTKINQGKTLGGCFKLRMNYGGTQKESNCISYMATASSLQREIELAFNSFDPRGISIVDRHSSSFTSGIGKVSVISTRDPSNGGQCYNITFDSAIGNIPEFTLDGSELTGGGSQVTVETLEEGESLGGTWALRFLRHGRNGTTKSLPFNVSGDGVTAALSAISGVVSAAVVRSYSNIDCLDGLCASELGQQEVYTYVVELTTEEGNINPTSPNDPVGVNDSSVWWPYAVSSLIGPNATVEVIRGWPTFSNSVRAVFNVSQAFSLSCGGWGGSYGGQGGGTVKPWIPKTYGNKNIGELLGGSGGGCGGIHPHEIFELALKGNISLGGSGGGALEFVAANDIFLGSLASISVNGGNGQLGYSQSGGGGSGGSVLLSAGGSISQEGIISAQGGNAGETFMPNPPNSGGGGGGGRIAFFAQSIYPSDGGVLDVKGGNQSRGIMSESGTVLIDTVEGSSFRTVGGMEDIIGAQGTNHSLCIEHFTNSSDYNPNETVDIASTAELDGPFISFSEFNTRPERLAFYIQIGPESLNSRLVSNNMGAVVSLYPPLNFSSALDLSLTLASICISLAESTGIRQASPLVNGRATPVSDWSILDNEIEKNMWYYVDVLISWNGTSESGLYSTRVNGVEKAWGIPFIATGGKLAHLGVSLYKNSVILLDEIYAGPDFTLSFRCPTIAAAGIYTEKQEETGWDHIFQPDAHSSTHPMQRHESFMSRRPAYNHNSMGGDILSFDGNGHPDYTYDYETYTSNDEIEAFEIEGASLLKVVSNDSGPNWGSTEGWGTGEKNMYYWYGERDNLEGNKNQTALLHGIGACSTSDHIHWRFEGIVLFSVNVTDNVEVLSTEELHFLQPQVLEKSANESTFVLWGTVENSARDKGLAGVAIGTHPAGPFRFVRSFYPDGNATYDQTVLKDKNGTGVLIRSYYAYTEYVLPGPVMNPIWEPVLGPNGEPDFGLSYHRAFYEPAYDDYHDIYLQRWRLEDKPWQIQCVNRISNDIREAIMDQFIGNGAYCKEPEEYKVVLGQGDPVITSRFKDPLDNLNNVWIPNSVVNVKAQPWWANYREGTCGLRNMDDGYEKNSSEVANRPSQEDRSNCSNIADNPVHGTPPDDLIGTLRVVQKRWAPYVAISRLTEDLLDTTGELVSYEGILEGGSRLASLAESLGWDPPYYAGGNLETTYHAPRKAEFETAMGFETRFHQYEEVYNDKARYSLACVVGGDCYPDRN